MPVVLSDFDNVRNIHVFGEIKFRHNILEIFGFQGHHTIGLPVPYSTAPTDNSYPCPCNPMVTSCTPRPNPVHLVTHPSSTVREQQRPRTYGHLGLLLQTVKQVHVNLSCMLRRWQSQD